MNLLGQVAGVASTEFGLSRMIWAAVNVRYDGAVSEHFISTSRWEETDSILYSVRSYRRKACRTLRRTTLHPRSPQLYPNQVPRRHHPIFRFHQSWCHICHHHRPSCLHRHQELSFVHFWRSLQPDGLEQQRHLIPVWSALCSMGYDRL